MKSEIKYCWALDGKDRLIHIKDVVCEARASGEFGTFDCPALGTQFSANSLNINKLAFYYTAFCQPDADMTKSMHCSLTNERLFIYGHNLPKTQQGSLPATTHSNKYHSRMNQIIKHR